jgi:hypothetical protein
MYKMIYTIYKISIAGEDYIGSTRDLKQRKREHKSACYNPNYHSYDSKIYTTIRANGGWDCCEITPVEEFECETKQQACIREEHWRREYKALLNTYKAFRTDEELKEDLKKNQIKRCAEKTDCDCGGKYYNPNKSRHLKTVRHQDFMQSTFGSA